MKCKPLMIQGTMSNSGKTFVTAGLCRIFAKDGYRCAPFKSQNMALNSYITKEGWEIGRAQAMQAEAAGIDPLVQMNPILLKPNSDMGSQVIVNGEVLGNYPAAQYFKMKPQLKPDIMKAFSYLRDHFDMIVLEGAGSPAEINLKENDIVNMGMAKMADANVILVADIDRGGVFASLYGTISLLEPEERSRIKGIIINKFRGDVEILRPGLEMIENLTGIPVVGVLPYAKIDIDDEDSLSEQLLQRSVTGGIDVAVIRLPHISNFTDFGAFDMMPEVSLRYVTKKAELGTPDLILLPGTKNTMYDLQWLRESGLEGAILRLKNQCRIAGICGGYQMMGEWLEDPCSVEHGGTMRGMGLLPTKTVFQKAKTRTRKEAVILNEAGQMVYGYEIHMGTTTKTGDGITSFLQFEDGQKEGFITENKRIFGTYLHGIFDADGFRMDLIRKIAKEKGMDLEDMEISLEAYKESQYDQLEQLLRDHLDMEKIYEMIRQEETVEEKELGRVHIYHGDGKGKTTAAMGLAIRAAGAGKRVAVYQFMKDGSTAERKILDRIPEITYIQGIEKVRFTRNMTEEEKEKQLEFYNQELFRVAELTKDCDLVILDEALYAVSLGQLSEELLIKFIKKRPETQELVLTGRNPSENIQMLADYISHIKKEKHPFDEGICARKGIEY